MQRDTQSKKEASGEACFATGVNLFLQFMTYDSKGQKFENLLRKLNII